MSGIESLNVLLGDVQAQTSFSVHNGYFNHVNTPLKWLNKEDDGAKILNEIIEVDVRERDQVIEFKILPDKV